MKQKKEATTKKGKTFLLQTSQQWTLTFFLIIIPTVISFNFSVRPDK